MKQEPTEKPKYADLITDELKEEFKEADLCFEALSLDSILSMPWVVESALQRQPLTTEKIRGVEKAVNNAVTQALNDGSVVSIRFSTLSEIIFCSQLLTKFIPVMRKSFDLIKDKSTLTRFELSNNSAILLGRKFQED